jgi:hypothetical protein
MHIQHNNELRIHLRRFGLALAFLAWVMPANASECNLPYWPKVLALCGISCGLSTIPTFIALSEYLKTKDSKCSDNTNKKPYQCEQLRELIGYCGTAGAFESVSLLTTLAWKISENFAPQRTDTLAFVSSLFVAGSVLTTGISIIEQFLRRSDAIVLMNATGIKTTEGCLITTIITEFVPVFSLGGIGIYAWLKRAEA